MECTLHRPICTSQRCTALDRHTDTRPTALCINHSANALCISHSAPRLSRLTLPYGLHQWVRHRRVRHRTCYYCTRGCGVHRALGHTLPKIDAGNITERNGSHAAGKTYQSVCRKPGKRTNVVRVQHGAVLYCAAKHEQTPSETNRVVSIMPTTDVATAILRIVTHFFPSDAEWRWKCMLF